MIFDLDGWVQAVGRFSKGALQVLACLVLGSWGLPNRIPRQEAWERANEYPPVGHPSGRFGGLKATLQGKAFP